MSHPVGPIKMKVMRLNPETKKRFRHHNKFVAVNDVTIAADEWEDVKREGETVETDKPAWYKRWIKKIGDIFK